MPDPYTVLRVANVILSVVVLVGMVRGIPGWRELALRPRLYGTGLLVLTAVTGYASVETLLTGSPGGPRIGAYTVALLLLGVATFAHETDRQTQTYASEED